MKADGCLDILIVEDEALIAMMAEDMVEALGHRVAGTVSTLADARHAIASVAFDAALLDVNLNGDSSMELAQALKVSGKPFAFTTGYGAAGIDPEHRDCPVLAKPYAFGDLEGLLAGFVQAAGTSSTTSTIDSNLG